MCDISAFFLTVHDEKKYIEQHFGFEYEKLEHYLILFKQWIASQKHLQQDFSDNCIKKFLVWSKLDIEKAKEKFERFCYNPITHKEFISNRIIAEDADLQQLHYFYIIPLATLTPSGYKVTFGGVLDAEKLEVVSMIRAAIMAFDFRIHQDATVAGETVVLDMNNLKPRHYAKIFGMPFMKFITFSWRNSPYLPKNFFVVNCDPLLEKGINLCKSILPEKLANRVAILNNPQDLHKYLPKQCLPSDYDGSQKSIEELNSAFTKFLLQKKEFLENISKLKPTGPIPENVKNYADEFGLDGSFRKLNID